MNQAAFVLPTDKVFEQQGLQRLQTVTVDYPVRALQDQQPRANSKELLLLGYIFLSRTNIPATFQSPGTTYHTRRMTEASYSPKLFLFRSQVHVTARDAKALLIAALHTSLERGPSSCQGSSQ